MIWPCHTAPRQTSFPWLTSLCTGESPANEKKTWLANIKDWTGLACVAGGFVGVWWPAAATTENEPREDENKLLNPNETASYAG